jgi:hypothetical protein
MTPTKLNRAPLTKRISALAVTAAAALSFVVFAPNAQAATPIKPTVEYRELQEALTALFGAGASVDNVSADDLALALTKAITDNPKLKPGNIAGEALKYAGSPAQADGGVKIARALFDHASTSSDLLAARDAIKRAGSGKGLNVALVPDFAAEFFPANATEADVIALARLVISSKPGAGAVVGGRAGELTLPQQTALTNAALAKTAKLTAATIDILKYVVAEVDQDALGEGNTDVFTRDIALTNATLAAKIGTGGVAGDPTNGGNIVDELLTADLPKLKSGIASFVKSVGKVADIEEIAKIALAVGEQIGTASTAKPTTTAIKFAAANGVVKSLAKAIVAKATTDTSTTNPNSGANKEDEIAEVAAGMVAQILNPLTINGVGGGKAQVTVKNAGAKILAIIKSAINATKPKKVQAAHTGIYLETVDDVVGSVAETLGSLRDGADSGLMNDAFFNEIVAYLTRKVNSVAGKANAGVVSAALEAGYLTGPSAIYEDGTLASGVLPPINGLIQNSDYPETDWRPN